LADFKKVKYRPIVPVDRYNDRSLVQTTLKRFTGIGAITTVIVFLAVLRSVYTERERDRGVGLNKTN